MKKILNWLLGKKEKVCIDFSQSMDLTDLPIVTFYQEELKLNFLLDTGSTCNIINKSILNNISSAKTEKSSSVFGMDGVDHDCPRLQIDIEYRGNKYTAEFLSCDLDKSFSNIKNETGVTIHGILGNDFFKKNKSILNFAELKAYLNK